MARLIVPLMLGFGVTLALVIGQKMSTDAMAVVLGVAVGVAASVPTSVLLLALLRRTQQDVLSRPAVEHPAFAQPPQPNIIVLNPGDGSRQRGLPPGYFPQPPVAAQDAGLRRLRVVGDDDDWG